METVLFEFKFYFERSYTVFEAADYLCVWDVLSLWTKCFDKDRIEGCRRQNRSEKNKEHALEVNEGFMCCV